MCVGGHMSTAMPLASIRPSTSISSHLHFWQDRRSIRADLTPATSRVLVLPSINLLQLDQQQSSHNNYRIHTLSRLLAAILTAQLQRYYLCHQKQSSQRFFSQLPEPCGSLLLARTKASAIHGRSPIECQPRNYLSTR